MDDRRSSRGGTRRRRFRTCRGTCGRGHSRCTILRVHKVDLGYGTNIVGGVLVSDVFTHERCKRGQLPVVLLHEGISRDESGGGILRELVLEDDQPGALGAREPLLHVALDFRRGRIRRRLGESPVVGAMSKVNETVGWKLG